MGLNTRGTDSTQNLVRLGSGWKDQIWSENLAVSQPFEVMKFQVDSKWIHSDPLRSGGLWERPPWLSLALYIDGLHCQTTTISWLWFHMDHLRLDDTSCSFYPHLRNNGCSSTDMSIFRLNILPPWIPSIYYIGSRFPIRFFFLYQSYEIVWDKNENLHCISSSNRRTYWTDKSNTQNLIKGFFFLSTRRLGWLPTSHRIFFQQLTQYIHSINSLLRKLRLSPHFRCQPHGKNHKPFFHQFSHQTWHNSVWITCWTSSLQRVYGQILWSTSHSATFIQSWRLHMVIMEKYQDHLTFRETRPPSSKSLQNIRPTRTIFLSPQTSNYPVLSSPSLPYVSSGTIHWSKNYCRPNHLQVSF